MKPDEMVIRSFYLRPSTDQASKYRCAAILKASDFSELDRAECQFSTTATVLDNGTQIGPSNDHAKGGIRGFFGAIKALLRTMWDSTTDFFTGRSCSNRCSSVFDFSCHIQYICIGWLVMFGLLLAILPAVAVLLWLLHQKGLFDPLYDWWEDVFGSEMSHDRTRLKHMKGHRHSHHHHHHGDHYHRHHHAHKKRRSGPSHHHNVLHRHGGQPDPVAEGERHRHSRHDAALGVQHRDHGHKHRHGKAVAALPRERDGGPSRLAPWPRGEDGVEYRERRHYGHRRDGERHHYRAV